MDIEYSITNINNLIKVNIESLFNVNITIIGEILQYKSSNNNQYFSLKDVNSNKNYTLLNCIIWGNKFSENMKVGKMIKCVGKLSYYTKTSNVSFICNNIKFNVSNDNDTLFNKLKKKFEEKGYFDKSIKKKLPSNITNIGLITSIDGAVIEDFKYVLNTNSYMGNLYVKNTLMQGAYAKDSICNNIKMLDELNLDVIIIARGGGSKEDLQPFSTKEIVETIYNCNTPVISAIGHETDSSLSDFVADVYAPTPSIAGVIIIKHIMNYGMELQYKQQFIKNTLIEKINNMKMNLKMKHKQLTIDNNQIYNNNIHKLNNLSFAIKQILTLKINQLKDKYNNCGIILKDANGNKILNYNQFLNISDNKLKNITIEFIKDTCVNAVNIKYKLNSSKNK